MDRGFEPATFHSVQMITKRLRPLGHEDWDVERCLQLLQNRRIWIKSTHVWQYNVSYWLLFDVYGNWLQDKICISFTNVDSICFWIKNFSVQVEIFSAPKAFIAPTPLGSWSILCFLWVNWFPLWYSIISTLATADQFFCFLLVLLLFLFALWQIWQYSDQNRVFDKYNCYLLTSLPCVIHT